MAVRSGTGTTSFWTEAMILPDKKDSQCKTDIIDSS